jgi:hypothetical protein
MIPAIQPNHLQEWLDSGVDEEIIALNVRSLSGTTSYDYLLYSPTISRRNDGRIRDRDLKKYQHIELGGWKNCHNLKRGTRLLRYSSPIF